MLARVYGRAWDKAHHEHGIAHLWLLAKARLVVVLKVAQHHLQVHIVRHVDLWGGIGRSATAGRRGGCTGARAPRPHTKTTEGWCGVAGGGLTGAAQRRGAYPSGCILNAACRAGRHSFGLAAPRTRRAMGATTARVRCLEKLQRARRSSLEYFLPPPCAPPPSPDQGVKMFTIMEMSIMLRSM